MLAILPKVTPNWVMTTFTVVGYMTENPIVFYWRDAEELALCLLKDFFLTDFFQVTPYKVYNIQGQRLYDLFMSAVAAWQMHTKFPNILNVPITLSSKKTQLVFKMKKSAHPVLLSLVFFDPEVCMAFPKATWALVAYLTVPIFTGTATVVASVLQGHGKIHHDPWNTDSIMCFYLAGYHGDRIKQLDILGEVGWSKIKTFINKCKNIGLSGVDKPFYEAWMASLPSEFSFMIPNTLHIIHKMVHDHILQWILSLVGKKEFDYRLSILQPMVGIQSWPQDISTLKQLTDWDYQAISWLIVAVGVRGQKPENKKEIADKHCIEIAGEHGEDNTGGQQVLKAHENTQKSASKAIQLLLEFLAMAQCSSFTEASIRALKEKLDDFHNIKADILLSGGRKSKGPWSLVDENFAKGLQNWKSSFHSPICLSFSRLGLATMSFLITTAII
ncbi:hypothetical protein CPB83DRAFT_900401 [Crepidotus variabilis]|uniref:Uncharacterized protein n=1 Tax=Crepidotus variabilis TaxID=179855 RepID=A0A9P6E374_9AGAR|nr:hypothetical protein CPB83DRAFT_900401 [Crepidotus variabilis]